MNHKNIFTFACALAVAMAPLDLKAASRQAGMDACADALVSKLSTDTGTTLNFQLAAGSESSKVKLNFRETYHLDARDPNTQKIIARADCVVDRKAKVRQLVSIPLSADDAAARALGL